MQSRPSDTRLRRKLILLWVLLLVASGLSIFMIGWLDSMDFKLALVRGDGIVNLELAWERDTAQNIVDGWHSSDLIPTAQKSIYWDFLFIAGYLTALTAAFALAWGPLTRTPVHSLWLLWFVGLLPLLAGASDFIENILMLSTLSDEEGVGTLRPLFTAGFAYAKFAFLGLFVALAMYLARPALITIARVRFSLLMLIIGIIVLFVPQWQEMLRAIMETDQGAGGSMESTQFWRAIWLACSSLVAAFSTWYSARVIFMFRLDGYATEKDDPMASLKRWLPRVLGAIIPFLIAMGFFIAIPSDRYSAALEPAAYQFVALILFLVVVLSRRAILKIPPDTPMINFVDRFADLHRQTKRPLIGLALGNLVFFLLILYFPEYADRVGAAAVVIIAVALIIPVGSLLVYFSARYRYPLLVVVAVLAVIFSLTNDNHSIRLCPSMQSTDRECRDADDKPLPVRRDGPFHEDASFTDFMDRWISQRQNASGAIPVFIVAAEGGGIRAAYWSAHVLATLQDKARALGLDFARHVLAVSGVSGGSLGGAVFAASVKHLGAKCSDASNCYSALAHQVLGEDFLSPTVATLMFPDLLQRLVPPPIFDDRAMTLERSWERAWQQFTNNEDFALPYDRLWQPNAKQEMPRPPLLLLNSTVVETGQRLIMSPLELASDGIEFDDVFRDAIDGRTLIGNGISLSTAVHLSARFTYVSPAGKVFWPGNDEQEASWYRLVDGGYFENSGSVTASELLDEVIRYERRYDAGLKPFIIHISNEPVIPDEERARKRISFYPILGELLSPLRALLNVRPARGFQSREFLQRKLVEDDPTAVRHVHFLPCKRKLDLPLGWALSQAVKNELAAQLPSNDRRLEEGAPRYNYENLELVLQHLRSGRASGVSSADRETALVRQCRRPN